jgi:hypothetical protein
VKSWFKSGVVDTAAGTAYVVGCVVLARWSCVHMWVQNIPYLTSRASTHFGSGSRHVEAVLTASNRYWGCVLVVLLEVAGSIGLGIVIERNVYGRHRKASAHHQRAQTGASAGEGAGVMADGRTSERTSEGLAVIDRAEPIRAWRAVNIIELRNQAVLTPLFMHGHLSVEGEAVCGVGARHLSPDAACSCGFYGMKDRRQLHGGVVAEVEFYGRVIEHENGYRAQFQRVLSITVPRFFNAQTLAAELGVEVRYW